MSDKVVSDANLHKFWKQFTTLSVRWWGCRRLFPMQIYTNFESNSQLNNRHIVLPLCCFRCKFTQILKAIHNIWAFVRLWSKVVSDANLHKFWKQFTTENYRRIMLSELFPMQIYTNFESNSQPLTGNKRWLTSCFRCKFTQILKAIHNFIRLKTI